MATLLAQLLQSDHGQTKPDRPTDGCAAPPAPLPSIRRTLAVDWDYAAAPIPQTFIDRRAGVLRTDFIYLGFLLYAAF